MAKKKRLADLVLTIKKKKKRRKKDKVKRLGENHKNIKGEKTDGEQKLNGRVK
jgi:hypothetical protein